MVTGAVVCGSAVVVVAAVVVVVVGCWVVLRIFRKDNSGITYKKRILQLRSYVWV